MNPWDPYDPNQYHQWERHVEITGDDGGRRPYWAIGVKKNERGDGGGGSGGGGLLGIPVAIGIVVAVFKSLTGDTADPSSTSIRPSPRTQGAQHSTYGTPRAAASIDTTIQVIYVPQGTQYYLGRQVGGPIYATEAASTKIHVGARAFEDGRGGVWCPGYMIVGGRLRLVTIPASWTPNEACLHHERAPVSSAATDNDDD